MVVDGASEVPGRGTLISGTSIGDHPESGSLLALSWRSGPEQVVRCVACEPVRRANRQWDLGVLVEGTFPDTVLTGQVLRAIT
jgi:hypothetical protein